MRFTVRVFLEIYHILSVSFFPFDFEGGMWDLWLFTLYINIKIGKNNCKMLD